MDPFDGSNSDQKNDSDRPGAKEAADQALMNEVLESSPLVPTAATTQQVYPRQNPVFPTGQYMGAPGMMVPNGHVGTPKMPPYLPMVGGHAMPPHGYPGANMYAQPGAPPNAHPSAPPNTNPGMPGSALGVSGMSEAGRSGMSHQEYSGARNSVPMQGERDSGTTNKRRLDEEESDRRVSQKTLAPTVLQPPQVEAPQDVLDSNLQTPATNGAPHPTGPTAALPGPVQEKNGSSNHKTPSATAPPSSSIDDDIFADADDDVPVGAVSTAVANSGAPVASIQSPSNNMKSPPRANYQSQSLSPDQRPSIRSIVLGNAGKVILGATKPSSVAAKNPSSVVAKKSSNVAAKKPSSVPSVVVRVGEKEKAPKRKTRPTRRVLIAKKEKEQATNLLQGVGDLLDWLPKGDCKFLAESFWIFTKYQLRWVLTQSKDQGEGLVPGDTLKALKDATPSVTASQLRDEILVKLATSKLLRPTGANDKESSHDKSTEVATSQVDKAPREVVETLAAADTKDESTPTKLSSELEKPNMDINVATQASKSDDLSSKHEAATGTTVVSGEAQSDSITEKNEGNKTEVNPQLAIDAIAAAVSNLDEGDRKAAEARMESWRGLIAKAKTEQPIEKQFPVDGPISFLFPVATQNFLASIPIKYLHGFLSLKKTETGAICDMFRIWRQKCNLSDMASLALGRHLTSIASRIGLALSSRPIVDADTRQWMLDPIVVLTGAARDFLVMDQRMYKATEFVEVRTKDLAMKLEEWRDRLSMVSLKGSGKVAMISAWKAGAKEAIEAEKDFGKVLHGVDLEAEALSAAEVAVTKDEAPEPVLPERVASAPKKIAPKVAAKPIDIGQVTQHPPPPSKEKAAMPLEIDRHLKYTLHSTMFLQDILGKATYELLSSANVKSAAELFAAERTEGSQLHRAVCDADRARSVSECESVIDSWCQSLRTELDLFRANLPAVASPPPPPPKSAAALPPKRAATPPPKSAKPPPQKKAKIKATVDSRPIVPRRTTTPRSFEDPFDGLSNVTKRFLATMNITTAEKFLSSRTTDISVIFVDWRIKEDMPELKGLGAIASVSGWKAQVRKFAKEMGLQDLADMEPANKASWGKEAREVSRKEGKEAPKRKVRTKPPPSSGHKLSHEDVLFGNSRHIFAVQDESDSKVQYRFELSVRRLDKDKLFRLFATYKGAVLQSSNGGQASKHCTVSLEASASDWSRSKLGVLSDVPVSAIGQKGDPCVPFKTMMPGRGLVELRRYGVHHLQIQELALLKEEMKVFVLSGDVDRPNEGAPEVGEANVLIHDAAKGNFQYLLYLDTRIEKGQTVPLRFPDVSTLLRSDKYDGTIFRGRHLINRALHALARSDLCAIRSFLTTEVSDACGSLSDIGDEANISRLKQVVEARQRLHWLSLRVLSLIDDRSTKENLSGLCFDWKAFIGSPKLLDSLPEGRRLDLKEALAVELKKEVLATLELDQVCGSASRSDWCRLASKLFDALIEGLVAQYCSPAVEPDQCSEAITSIFEKSYSTPLSRDTVDDCILQFRPSGSSGTDEAADGYPGEPSSSFQSSIQQAYLDTMSLCGESPYDLEEPQCLEVIFCDGPISDSGGMPTVVTKRPANVTKGSAVLSVQWYRRQQWEIASTVLSCFSSLIGPTDNAWFNFEKIDSAMREVANKQIDTSSPPDIESESCSTLRLPSPPVDPEKQRYEPHSLQFFLGLVWPALRKLQWRLDAGDSPSDVVYFTPGLPGRSGKLAKLLKKESDRKRARLAREVNDVGLGFVPKLTKRLLVHAVLAGKDKEDGVKEKEENLPSSYSKKARGGTVPVRNILDQFLVYIRSRLKESDQEGRDRANSIVASLRDCFDALAPNISDGKAESEMEKLPGQYPCDVFGCDVLMQFLLALPSVLRQPSVPLKEIGDTLAAIQELTEFVVLNYKELLGEQFHPPAEHYLGQHQANSSALVSRLRRLDSSEQAVASAANHEGLTEILLASDNAKLTDYLVRVLEQATPCSATFEDTQKKNRSIEEGFPGLTCRFCLGSGGEGRYFFKTAESLSASTSILDKHFAKCQSVPDDVKSEIVLCKRRHTDQRKFLAVGAQQEFFLRLWDRMWSSKTAGGLTSNVYLAPNGGNSVGGAATEDSNPDSSDSGNIEFRDHITLLDFVRSTKPWKGDNGVQDALEQYYNCLDYGGRIFGTDAMPKNFNSEWLLAKVSPKTFGRKIKGIPG